MSSVGRNLSFLASTSFSPHPSPSLPLLLSFSMRSCSLLAVAFLGALASSVSAEVAPQSFVVSSFFLRFSAFQARSPSPSTTISSFLKLTPSLPPSFRDQSTSLNAPFLEQFNDSYVFIPFDEGKGVKKGDELGRSNVLTLSSFLLVLSFLSSAGSPVGPPPPLSSRLPSVGRPSRTLECGP